MPPGRETRKDIQIPSAPAFKIEFLTHLLVKTNPALLRVDLLLSNVGRWGERGGRDRTGALGGRTGMSRDRTGMSGNLTGMLGDRTGMLGGGSPGVNRSRAIRQTVRGASTVTILWALAPHRVQAAPNLPSVHRALCAMAMKGHGTERVNEVRTNFYSIATGSFIFGT